MRDGLTDKLLTAGVSYLTRDISELLQRERKYNFDRMIYVVASEQDLHVKQFFKVRNGVFSASSV